MAKAKKFIITLEKGYKKLNFSFDEWAIAQSFIESAVTHKVDDEDDDDQIKVSVSTKEVE